MKSTFAIAALTSTLASAMKVEANLLSAIQNETTTNNLIGEVAVFVPTTDENTFLKVS